MSEPMLPADFADLEPFAATWCLADEPARWARRMASTMPQMHAFYAAAFPRIEAALGYCDKFQYDELPGDARNLLHLVHSTIMVAMCVEIWHQPRVVDGGTAELHRVGEPTP